ncbi:head-tail joining protein [Ramlibacter sp. Leaf400]|uniref:head-tail joining protein n=1 Tax=Ramlibacter sp. Leaf400 TaxID=1736365 RepID=UPI0006FD2F66|nr:hypothetical protein [Ramlibacter sp. Leaf400]KQT10968.1 hypothetical protein ASG30_09220 [Ramlibacter sp. Leaf400]
MAFVEDFTVFFADFSVPATPEGGAAVTVIFDRAHIEAMGGDISGTRPVALAVSADVSSWLPRTTLVAIQGSTYLLSDVQPDGTGLSLLIFEVAT